ncbi:MAG: hypothetical protein DHS20C20_30690 [Ardenticatenaceae bacterium]|nr:MAG: hypothetical protein DHS20C20_30690 [Ardenticatenaceae bacterium]
MTNFVFDPKSHEDDTAAKIVFALERLSHLFRIHWWEQNKAFSLSPLQMQIVIALRFQPQKNSVTFIANYLDLTNATVSDAVRMLVKKGYIEKKSDGEDGRRHHLTLTELGRNTAEGLALFGNQIRDFVSSQPNQESFLESLLHLMKSLQEHQFIPLQQMCTTCRFLRSGIADAAYYCQLLEKPLGTEDLRVHCLEYEAMA